LFTDEAKDYITEATPEGMPKHILIKEVVKHPNIHFYKVPRLGSYLAIKLEYNSCLFEQALDQAVLNYSEVNEKRRELEIEKKEHEEQ